MGQSPALRKYCRSQDIPIQAWTHLKYIRYLADKMELKDLHVKLRWKFKFFNIPDQAFLHIKQISNTVKYIVFYP